MKKAVVTGGAGFIGSHVVDGLLQSGAKVLVIDDMSSGSESNLASSKDEFSSNLSIFVSDICSKEARAKIEEFKPDVILHHAAQINVRRSVEDPVFDASKNVVGLVNILEAARVSNCKQFILASTGGAIYGEQSSFPADEDHSIHPESPYGISKRAGELYLDFYARAHGLSTVALRYANVYGPRQNPHGEAGVVAIFSERIFAGTPLRVFGDGLQTRDFVFVKDVVSANMLALEKITPGVFTAYNVGHGKEVSVLDIVDALSTYWKKCDRPENLAEKIEVEHGPAPKGEQRRSVIDPTKISSELGWCAEVPLGVGLGLTLESFRT